MQVLSHLEDVITHWAGTRQDWGFVEEATAAAMTGGGGCNSSGGGRGGEGRGEVSSPVQPSHESDLEEGEIPGEASNSDPKIGESREPMSAVPDINKPIDLAVLGQGEDRGSLDTSRHVRAVKGRSKVWKNLCPSWVLGSCEDVRCPCAHGYLPRMCPKAFCPSSAHGMCPYAHSTEELQGMQASEAVTRRIAAVAVTPTLCADHLGSGGCLRGGACPFAHSTEELLQALEGSAYRSIQREVHLPIETRDHHDIKVRSMLCWHWLHGRLVLLRVLSRISLRSQEAQ